MGVTGVPDWLIRGWRWGRAWSAIGDLHDDLYRRGCPREWADMVYETLMAAYGLDWLGARSGWVLRRFGRWRYRVKEAEEWTVEKIERDVGDLVERLRARGVWPRRPLLLRVFAALPAV